MKKLIAVLMTLACTNAFAIEFITEADVQSALGADKVIEIGRYTAQEKLVAENESCLNATYSRSGRAYVVKKENKALLFVTVSGLAGLQECGEL